MQASCSDTASSDTSSQTTTVSASSDSASETAFSTMPPSSLMCERSTDDPTVEKWISSLGDSHVSPSALPASVKEATTREISGRKPFAFFEKSSRGSLSLRMCQGSLALMGISEPSSETWPRVGILQGGAVYQLPLAELPTSEIGCGYLPTPMASTGAYNRGGGSGRIGPIRYSLRAMANKGLWPTPKASRRGDCPSERVRRSPSLESAVRMWPTPRASENENRQMKPTPSQLAGKHGMSLGVAVNMWPTPTVSGNNNVAGMSEKSGNGLATAAGGQLNPMWVEWLMGWPLGASDLKPLETDKFRSWRQQHSGF